MAPGERPGDDSMDEPRPDTPELELTAALAGAADAEDALQLGPADAEPAPPPAGDDPFAMHLADHAPKSPARKPAEPILPQKPAKAVTPEANDSVVAALMGRPIAKTAKPKDEAEPPAAEPLMAETKAEAAEPLPFLTCVEDLSDFVLLSGDSEELMPADTGLAHGSLSGVVTSSALAPSPGTPGEGWGGGLPIAETQPDAEDTLSDHGLVHQIPSDDVMAEAVDYSTPIVIPPAASTAPAAASNRLATARITTQPLSAQQAKEPEPARSPAPRRAVPVAPVWPTIAPIPTPPVFSIAIPAVAPPKPAWPTPPAAVRPAIAPLPVVAPPVPSPVPSPAAVRPMPVTPEPPAGPTGAWWTIPLTFVGIAIVACAMLIPAADENRRDAYELAKIERDVAYFQKQSEVNQDFLKRVNTDPTLAERLAMRQLHQTREGVRLAPLAARPDRDHFGASPYAMTRLDPPPPLAPYRPMPGKLSEWFLGEKRAQHMASLGLLVAGAGVLLGGRRGNRERPLVPSPGTAARG